MKEDVKRENSNRDRCLVRHRRGPDGGDGVAGASVALASYGSTGIGWLHAKYTQGASPVPPVALRWGRAITGFGEHVVWAWWQQAERLTDGLGDCPDDDVGALAEDLHLAVGNLEVLG